MCPNVLQAYGLANLTDDISVNLKSTIEINAGLKALYQISDLLSAGGHFTFKNHADNGIESAATPQKNPASAAVANQMAKDYGNMDDGFNEYILGLSVAAQWIPNLQTVLFFERTLDTAHEGCQNGTDNKAEIGLRLNVQF
jgi:hypothetical protein